MAYSTLFQRWREHDLSLIALLTAGLPGAACPPSALSDTKPHLAIEIIEELVALARQVLLLILAPIRASMGPASTAEQVGWPHRLLYCL
jgi:hypothetical protein